MDRRLLHLFCLLAWIVISGCSVRLKPGTSYCYLCCACVGSGSLKILDDQNFEIEYEEYEKRKHPIIVIGKGSYVQNKRLIQLTFDDMAVMKPEIQLRKIADSKQIELRVREVLDPVRPDSVGMAMVVIKDLKMNKVLAEEFVNPSMDPVNNVLVVKTPGSNSGPWIVEASFMQNKTSFPIHDPGIYEVEIMMPSDYADIHLGRKDSMNFKITRYPTETTIRQIGNRKIFFTTESCYCD